MWSASVSRRERGQAYVEFVIVIPVVLLLIFLAWEFAYFWWARMVVSTATFEAARAVAVGEPVEDGYAIYDDLVVNGLGQMSQQHAGGFSLYAQPAFRSVRANASVPYRWPSGLAALMGFSPDLTLRASAFFRLEEFYPGPPEQFE